MLSNNHNSCAFAEQIVSYIYDEATAKERENFEAHLLDCLPCADEIAGFGLIRSSIGEWRKSVVFALDVPALNIPQLRPVVVEKEQVSLIDELRKLFTFSPAWVGGFAALLICLGLVWLFFGNSKNEMIAEIPPIVEEKPVELPKEEKAFVNPQDEKSADVPQNVKQVEQKTVAPKNQTIKATNTPKLKSVRPKMDGATATNKSVNRNNKSNYAQTNDAPKLVEMNEEDDNSLRLAELFDEIGSE